MKSPARSLVQFSLAAAAAVLLSSCYQYPSYSHSHRGAVHGALLGGGAGALIGSASGNAGEGAIIGALAGAVGGSVIGNSRDRYYRYGGSGYYRTPSSYRRSGYYYPTAYSRSYGRTYSRSGYYSPSLYRGSSAYPGFYRRTGRYGW